MRFPKVFLQKLFAILVATNIGWAGEPTEAEQHITIRSTKRPEYPYDGDGSRKGVIRFKAWLGRLWKRQQAGWWPKTYRLSPTQRTFAHDRTAKGRTRNFAKTTLSQFSTTSIESRA